MAAHGSSTKDQLSLAEYLKLARMKSGLSLKQVEAATDRLISPPYLSTVENGKISKPSPMFLRALSYLYGISFEALAFLAGYPPMKRVEDNANSRLADCELSRGEELELIRYLKFLRARTDAGDKVSRLARTAKQSNQKNIATERVRS